MTNTSRTELVPVNPWHICQPLAVLCQLESSSGEIGHRCQWLSVSCPTQVPSPVCCPQFPAQVPCPSFLPQFLSSLLPAVPAGQFSPPVPCPSSLSQVPCLQFAAASSLQVPCPSSLSQVPCPQFAAPSSCPPLPCAQFPVKFPDRFLPLPRLEAPHAAVGDQPRLRSTCRP